MCEVCNLLSSFITIISNLLFQGGNLECSKDSDDLSVGSLCLKKWFRTAKAIVLYLNDGTLQVRCLILLSSWFHIFNVKAFQLVWITLHLILFFPVNTSILLKFILYRMNFGVTWLHFAHVLLHSLYHITDKQVFLFFK